MFEFLDPIELSLLYLFLNLIKNTLKTYYFRNLSVFKQSVEFFFIPYSFLMFDKFPLFFRSKDS